MKKLTLLTVLTLFSVITFAQFNVSTFNSNDLFWTRGQVGIGLDNPLSKLDIRLYSDFMYTDESGLRITYPIPVLGPPNSKPTVNENIFHIRQNAPIGSGFSTKMVVKVNGNVGVATDAPDAKFHVKNINGVKLDAHLEGFTLIDGSEASLLLGRQTGAPYGEWGIEYNNWSGGLNFWKPAGSNGFGNYFLFIADNGNVSIGTDDAQGYKLAVKGDVIAERVVVKLHADWPDFVFASEYGLMPLEEVEEYIDENHHLPNVPSAEEVAEDGIDVGEINAALLQKIEELTLYMIELKKEIELLKTTISN